VRRPPLANKLPLVPKLHPVPSLHLERRLPLVRRLHRVPSLLLRKQRRLRKQPGPLQVNKNLVSSGLTATYCAMPLDS
jgi:hypothetical protein